MIRKFLSLLLSISLIAPSVFADETPPTTETAVAQAGAAGANPGSVAPSGSADNLLFTGSFLYSVPIEVPPGLSGMQPQINLQYNSSAGNGWLGVGWDLSVGTIQRSMKNGVPAYSASDTFVFTMRGQSQELVKIPDGTYRAKIEGAFMKFIREGDGWKIWDKTGTVTRLGQTAASRLDHPSLSGPEKTFLWGVDEILDRNGNTMTFSYEKPASGYQLYLKEILYGANVNAPAPMDQMNRKVTLTREARPDVMTNYRPGFNLRTADRLKQIETFVLMSGTWEPAKRYDVSYAMNSNRVQSHLASVQVTGIDGASTLSLPPTEFQHIPADSEWHYQGTNSTYAIPVHMQVDNRDNGARFVELNGDGRADLIQYVVVDGIHFKKTFINTSSGWQDVTGQWDIPQPITTAASGSSTTLEAGVRFSDLNSDGLTDCVISHINRNFNPPGPYEKILINTGSGWSDQTSTWALPANPDIPSESIYLVESVSGNQQMSRGAQFADVNGDGKPDLLLAYHDYPSGAFKSYAWLNNNSGWVRDDSYALPWSLAVLGNNTSRTNGMTTIDINGDGTLDCVQSFYNENTGSLTNRVWFNSAPGWVLSTASEALPFGIQMFVYTTANTMRDNGVRWVDLNSDGLQDLIQSVSASGSGGIQKVYLNTGTGWTETVGWSPPNYFTSLTGGGYGINIVDIDGDGNPDWVRSHYYSGNHNNEIFLSNSYPDVLTTIESSIGGIISLTYGKSGLTQSLPFKVTTLEQIDRNSGIGAILSTQFTYQGGLFDKSEKEFLGFSEVHTTDAAGSVSVTRYLQDKDPFGAPAPENAFKGRVFQTEQRNASGTVLTASETRWERVEPHAGVHFVRPQWQTATDFTGTSPLTVKTESFYDQYGNVIETLNHGDTAIAGDEITQEIDYAIDTVNNFLSFPSETRAYDDLGALLSHTRFTYDGNANVTQVENRLDLPTEKWLSSQTTYDARGLVATVTDAKNFTTTTSFDDYGYPTSVSNPLGHTVQSTYDPRTGNVLTDTDINNQSTTYRYDALGRQTKIIGPLDSETYPTAETIYNDALLGQPNAQFIETHARERHGEADTIWSKSYFDGLGRTYRSEQEDVGKTVIAETQFDLRGLQSHVSIPRFSDASGPVLWTQTTYDALGRPVTTTRPDGTFTQTAYQGRLTFVTDPNGNTQSSETDAYGRVIRRYEPSIPNPTEYDYDASGNLVKVTDSQGHQTHFEYDSLGRKLSMTDPNAGTWTYLYDDNGNLVSQTDARGITLTMNYDALDRLIQKKNGAAVLASYTYDETDPTNRPYSKGRLTTVTDPSGTSSFYHDKLGRVTRQVKSVDAQNYEVKTEYDGLGRTVKVTYPNDEDVAYSYDAAGRIAQVSNGAGTEIHAAYSDYDALGRPLSMSQNNNATQTTTQYDSLRQTLASLHTVSNSTSPAQSIQHLLYDFDNAGNLISIDDEIDSSMSQVFEYDALHRLTKATGMYGEENYTYDSLGNFLTKGPFSYVYDDPNHPYAVTEIVPDRMPAEDESTLLAWHLDPSEPIYSVSGAVSSEGGTGAPSVKVVLTGSFDQALASDVDGETSSDGEFEFRGLPGGPGTIYSLSVSSGGMVATPSGYAYNNLSSSQTGQNFALSAGEEPLDPAGLRVPRSAVAMGGLPQIGGTSSEWTGSIIGALGYGDASSSTNHDLRSGYSPLPDGADLSTQTASQYLAPPPAAGQGVVGPGFVEGKLDQALSFNGATDVFVFPESQSIAPSNFSVMLWVNPDEIPVTGSATLFSKSNGASLGNLPDGFRVSISTNSRIAFEAGSEVLLTPSPLLPLTWSFVTATYDGSAMKLYINGELDSEKSTSGGLVSNSYPAAIGASLTEWKRLATGTLFKGAIDEPRLHDRAWSAAEIAEAFNVFTGEMAFTYDANGNLTTKTTNETVFTYNYDAQGRLASVARPGVDPVSFTYDGDGGRVKKIAGSDESLYIGKLFEIRSDNTYVNHVFAGSQMICDYVKPIGGGTPQMFDIHSDHLGSSSLVTDSAGQVVQSLHYSPFGEIVSNSGSSPLKHKYTQQESDPETGLYFYNARYYDPAIARFISADSIVQSPGDPQTLNRFAYVRNNPMILTDPSGNSFLERLAYLAFPMFAPSLSYNGAAGNINNSEDFRKYAYQAAAYNAAIAAVGFGIGAGIPGTIPYKVMAKIFPGGWNVQAVGFYESANQIVVSAGTNGWSVLGWGSATYGTASIHYYLQEKRNNPGTKPDNPTNPQYCWNCLADANSGTGRSNAERAAFRQAESGQIRGDEDLLPYLHFDIGYSGIGPGSMRPFGTLGLKLSNTGGYFYYGFGLGGGKGVSVTVNAGSPIKSGIEIGGNIRGGYKYGSMIAASRSYAMSSYSGHLGIGYGFGLGGGLAIIQTIQLFSWEQ